MHAVGEAAIATSYYWILLFVLQFRTRSILGQCLFLLICLPAFRLHEGTFLLTIVLLLALVLRSQTASGNLREAIFVGLASLLLAAILVYQIVSIIYPAYPDDRAHIVQGLMHFEFLYVDHHFNLPLVTGALALTAVGAVSFVCGTLPSKEATRYPCVIFAPNGIVNAIIDLPEGTSFRPFDPERPDLLPKLRGIYFSPYKRFLAGQS